MEGEKKWFVVARQVNRRRPDITYFQPYARRTKTQFRDHDLLKLDQITGNVRSVKKDTNHSSVLTSDALNFKVNTVLYYYCIYFEI